MLNATHGSSVVIGALVADVASVSGCGTAYTRVMTGGSTTKRAEERDVILSPCVGTRETVRLMTPSMGGVTNCTAFELANVMMGCPGKEERPAMSPATLPAITAPFMMMRRPQNPPPVPSVVKREIPPGLVPFPPSVVGRGDEDGVGDGVRDADETRAGTSHTKGKA